MTRLAPGALIERTDTENQPQMKRPHNSQRPRGAISHSSVSWLAACCLLFTACGFSFQDLFVVSGTPYQRNGYQRIQDTLEALGTGESRWDYNGDIRKPGLIESICLPVLEHQFVLVWGQSAVVKVPHDSHFYHRSLPYVSSEPNVYQSKLFLNIFGKSSSSTN